MISKDFLECVNNTRWESISHWINGESRTSHANDPYTSAWQEGRRTVVLEIINLVGADLEAIRKRIDMQEQARMQNRA